VIGGRVAPHAQIVQAEDLAVDEPLDACCGHCGKQVAFTTSELLAAIRAGKTPTIVKGRPQQR
jgi:hypothetical protein